MFTLKSLRRLVVTTAIALATTGLVLTMPLSALRESLAPPAPLAT